MFGGLLFLTSPAEQALPQSARSLNDHRPDERTEAQRFRGYGLSDAAQSSFDILREGGGEPRRQILHEAGAAELRQHAGEAIRNRDVDTSRSFIEGNELVAEITACGGAGAGIASRTLDTARMRACVALDLCDPAELSCNRAELHADLSRRAISRSVFDRSTRQAGRDLVDPAEEAPDFIKR